MSNDAHRPRRTMGIIDNSSNYCIISLDFVCNHADENKRNLVKGHVIVFTVIVALLVASHFYTFKQGVRSGFGDGTGYSATTNQLLTGQMYGVVTQWQHVGTSYRTFLEPGDNHRQRMFDLDQKLIAGSWYRWTGNTFVLATPGKSDIASFSPPRM